jgi:NADPH:quinone reductase
MRAIVVREFGNPDVMQVDEVPDPVAGPSDVLVRMRATGVNPVDTYIRAGTYARKPALPYLPGSDGAGEIEAVGADVRGFAVGDRVYVHGTSGGALSGTYAERAISAPHQVHLLPARTSFSQGAALGVPYATAHRALFDCALVQSSETVFVHGATGGVGIAAVQLAHAHGATVFGSGGSDRGLAMIRQQGAEVAVDHRAPDYTDEIMRATGGRGVDVILEMAAHLNLDRDLGLLAPRGRVVVVGNRGRIEIDPRQAMSRDATIRGMLLANASPEELRAIHAALTEGLATGALDPVVGHELRLDDAPRAHELVMQPGALGKIVLVP